MIYCRGDVKLSTSLSDDGQMMWQHKFQSAKVQKGTKVTQKPQSEDGVYVSFEAKRYLVVLQNNHIGLVLKLARCHLR